MKKLMIMVLAFAVVGNVAAFAQGTDKDSDNMKMGADKAPLKSIKGTIKADGDKVHFRGRFRPEVVGHHEPGSGKGT